MPAKKVEKPAAPPKPAPEKTPAEKVEKPVGTPQREIADSKVDTVHVGAEPRTAVPVKSSQPVTLPTPVPQPAAMLAKDLGAEKFLVKCLTALKETASQEEITKAVNGEWARIAPFKLQSALAMIKAKFAQGGFNPAGSYIIGAGDAVDKDRNVLGAVVFLLKDKRFTNLKLLGKSVVEYEQLGNGRMVSKMNAPKFIIDPASVESIHAHDLVIYNALLDAAIPKDQVTTHEFKQYEILCMECKVRGFGEDYTNPLPTKNGDLKFTLSPLAVVEWDISAWVHARKFGDAFLAMLGDAELNEYRKMDTEGKAAFLDAMLRDQIVMVAGKVGKEVFKEYNGFKTLELDVITLMLRPDELDPVVYESRPARVAKPAMVNTDALLSGQSIGQAEFPTEPQAEQPVGGTPVQLPPEILAKIAEIKAITGKDEALIQQDALDVQEANAVGEISVSLLEALDTLLMLEKEKAAKSILPPPEHVPDMTNPEDDTPALKRFRQLAVKAKNWGITYDQFLAYAKQYNLKEVSAESLPKDVFEAFVNANKGGK